MVEQRSGDNLQLFWNRFLEGDTEAFSLIYTRNIRNLLNYGYKLCREKELVHDAVQEVFTDLFLKKEKNHTPVHDVKSYLFVSLKHSVMKKVALRRRFEAPPEGEEPENEDFDCRFGVDLRGDDEGISEEKHLLLQKAIRELTCREKEAIFLRFEEEMEYPQIAAIMGITVESCRKMVYRAVLALRKIIFHD